MFSFGKMGTSDPNREKGPTKGAPGDPKTTLGVSKAEFFHRLRFGLWGSSLCRVFESGFSRLTQQDKYQPYLLSNLGVRWSGVRLGCVYVKV